MNKEIIKYLNWLKNKEYIIKYRVCEFPDNWVIVLNYSLFTCNDVEVYFSVKNNANLYEFMDIIKHYADDLEDNIYSCLESDNDFYGYNSKEKLDERIKEEKEFLYNIVNKYYIDNILITLEQEVKSYCDNNDNELIMRYLVNEIFYNYQDNLLNYDDYKNVKMLTLNDIINIASNMCNLYYFNEGVNEIIGDNINNYIYKDKVKGGN